MNYLDIIIIVFCAIGFILGFKDGLVRKIIGLIGLIAGVAFAFEFSDKLGKLLIGIFNNDEYLANVVAGILIFLVTVLIATIIKRIVHPIDKLNMFINQFSGGVIGVIQVLFFLSGFFLFLNIFSYPEKKAREDSVLFKFTFNLIPGSIDFIIGHRAKATDYIKYFIDRQENDSGNDSLKTE